MRAAKAPASLKAGDAALMTTGDIDGDGDVDVVVRGRSGLSIWRNDGGSRRASLRLHLTARVTNRAAVGTKIDMRAGSLRQRIETSAATPAAAPADIVFGLGDRPGADVARVLWPSGILQAETASGEAGGKPAFLVGSHRDRGARSQAVVLPVSLHVERRALRVHHRFSRRRRDGLLAGARRAQHAGSGRVHRGSRDATSLPATAASSCG